VSVKLVPKIKAPQDRRIVHRKSAPVNASMLRKVQKRVRDLYS
jgi:hypothetical protein